MVLHRGGASERDVRQPLNTLHGTEHRHSEGADAMVGLSLALRLASSLTSCSHSPARTSASAQDQICTHPLLAPYPHRTVGCGRLESLGLSA